MVLIRIRGLIRIGSKPKAQFRTPAKQMRRADITRIEVIAPYICAADGMATRRSEAVPVSVGALKNAMKLLVRVCVIDI